MLKKITAAAALVLSLGVVPMAGHADQTNGCLAHNDNVGSTSIYVGSYGEGLSCTYTAGSATGQVVQATPNSISISFPWLNPNTGLVETVTKSIQGTLTPPGVATWTDVRAVGAQVTVNVGPDAGLGAIGTVFAGDAS